MTDADVSCAEIEAHPMDVLWTQIIELERRAHSRDEEARRLERSEALRIQSLERESGELRRRAQALRKQRIDAMTRALSEQFDRRAANQR
jgi:hypothetical protein